MTKRFIPRSIEEITPQWLTDALTESGVLRNNSVKNVSTEMIGEQGYMGILGRLNLEYETSDDGLPTSMIAKLPTREFKNRITGEIFLHYERENRLYDEYLIKLPTKTPKCYFSDMDSGVGERTINFSYFLYNKLPKWLINVFLIFFGLYVLAKKRRYILLIEDFADLEYIDQRDGCSHEDAKLVMRSLGKGQAVFWNNPEVNQYWLKPDSEIGRLMGLLYENGLPVVERNFEDRLTPKIKTVFDWVLKNNGRIDNFILTRPTTLVHSDFRIDNIFFNRKENEIAIIDWQGAYRGLGISDLAYFCTGSGSQPFTPEQVDELIITYHQGLQEGGVSSYSLEECRLDYTYGLFVALRYIVIANGALEIDNDSDLQKLSELWFDRMKLMVENLDLSSI
jgi:hypothetical protein